MSARGRATLYAFLALAVGVLAYVLGVGSFLGQQAEASVLEASDFTTNPPAPLSLVSIYTVIVALVVIALIAAITHGVGRALTISVVSVVAVLTAQLLKRSWLERPELFEFDAPNTFPSGHMTVFGVVAAGLIWAVPRSSRGIVALLGFALVSVVSWQLLEYGWHRPSDVLGAQALVLLAFSLAALFGSQRSKQPYTKAGAAWGGLNAIVSVSLTLIGFVLLAGGLILVLVAGSVRSDELLLTGGEIVMGGVSALVVRTLAKICPA